MAFEKTKEPPHSPINIHVLILSGRSGVGKSSVANEMSSHLSYLGIPHASIDGDNLDAIYPEEQDAEIMLQNLENMWRTYHSLRGCTRVIISGTAIVLERDAVRETIERASRGIHSTDHEVHVDVVNVILTASDSAAADRLERREIGSTLQEHLESSMRMSHVLEESIDDDKFVRRVSTNNRTVADIAVDILESAKWVDSCRN